DLGFTTLGFQCKAAFDIDAAALTTHAKNINAPTIRWDLSTGKLPITASSVDVVLAGSPCQGFSTAGHRCLDDPRNNLLMTAAEIAHSLRPKLCLMENVPGLMYGDHHEYWDRLVCFWRSNGYFVSFSRISSQDRGVCQR